MSKPLLRQPRAVLPSRQPFVAARRRASGGRGGRFLREDGRYAMVPTQDIAYPLDAPAGSVSAPSYSLGGDTGIYAPADEVVAISCNGVEVARFTEDGIGFGETAPDASALFELESTTQGVLFPRMTTTQRDAISSPATGLVIFNTTTGRHNYYNGTYWRGFAEYRVSAARLEAGPIAAVPLYHQAIASNLLGIGVDVDFTARGVTINDLHNNGSKPADWTWRLRKNGGATSDVATATFDWNASNLTEQVTTATFTAVSFAAGDRMHMLTDGPANVTLPAITATVWGTLD